MVDYHGYYSLELDDAIEETLSDMLIEVSPRSFKDEEASADGYNLDKATPIQLLNWAWRVYRATPSSYPVWENDIIESLYKLKVLSARW